MNHPFIEIGPEQLTEWCAFVQEALRRWRLEPGWIGSGRVPPAQGLDIAAGLRRLRQLESIGILWRDVTGSARLEETGQALSELAACCLEQALGAAREAVRERYGELTDAEGRPAGLAIIGLGKLGGNELNFNSDLDIVFVHDARGESSGPRRLPAREYLNRVARELVRLMEQVTAEGRVWLIDTRLRPFGQSGALVWSSEAMEQYFLNEGRSWERYAWLKARPVAGDLELGRDLIRRLRPFVFRRYLDYGLIDSLRKLHAEIERTGRRVDFKGDIKRGPGGIRELEFLVQSVQLLRGGRERALRTTGFLPALAAVRDQGLMAEDRAARIEADYRYLRILENRLQAVTGRQTHHLPEDAPVRDRLARIMGEPDWRALDDRVDRIRQRVAREFRAHFEEPAASGGAGTELWPPDERLGDKLAEAGFEDPDSARGGLVQLSERLGRRPLSAEARRRLDRLMPRLLDEVLSETPPDPGFEELLNLIETIARRSAYLALLRERPQTLKRLVRVFRRSGRVAGWIIASPHLLDDLLDPVRGFGLPVRPQMNPDDIESSLEALGRYRQGGFLRTALGQLDASLDSMAARAQLTRVAEDVLACALELTGPGREPPLAIIGYGNLGAGELHFTSDLDLVFLHRAGETPLRAAQKLINAMQLPLAGGKLYAIDTRLRPNGNAGLLVSSIESFSDYQQKHAWTWEHQALIRARWVGGDPALAGPFDEIRTRALCREREAAPTRQALEEMRERQRRERPEDPYRRLLTDIQFVAELGVLLKAASHPALAELRQTAAQLEALTDCGELPAQDASLLAEAQAKALEMRDRNFLERGRKESMPEGLQSAVEEIWARTFRADS